MSLPSTVIVATRRSQPSTSPLYVITSVLPRGGLDNELLGSEAQHSLGLAFGSVPRADRLGLGGVHIRQPERDAVGFAAVAIRPLDDLHGLGAGHRSGAGSEG